MNLRSTWTASVTLLALIAFAGIANAQLIKPFNEQDPTSFSTSTYANNGRGNKFKCNIDGQAVYQLGVYYPNSSSQAKTIKLWDVASQTALAEVTTTPGSGWIWVDLANPVPLENGKEYLVTTYGDGYYFTSGAPASWKYTGDMQYMGMQYCNGCGTSKIFPTSFLSSNYLYGVSDFAYGPEASEWTGANSSDWNDAGNWSQDVPSDSLGAKIPDAASTPNDPILPSTIQDCEGLEVDTGGILQGDVGSLRILKNWKVKSGGLFVPGTSTIVYDGDGDQEITLTGSTMGNIDIQNTVGEISFLDEISAANAGSFTSAVGSDIAFYDATLNFAGMTFDNKGTISLGLDGGGTVATLQSITTAGQNLGNVEIEVPDAMDEVEFLGAVGFESLTLSGMGTISFYQPFNANVAVNVNMDGVLNCAGISGNADLNFAGPGDMTFTATINGKDLNHTGEGNLIVNAAVNLTGKANFVSSGPLTTATITGTLTTGTGFLIDPSFSGVGDCVTINGSTVNGGDIEFVSGSVTVAGNISSDGKMRVTTDGIVTFGNAVSTVNSFELDGNGSVICSGLVNVEGLFTTAGGGDFTGNVTLVVGADLNHNSTGNFEISGTLRLDGNAPQIVRTNGMQISASQLDFRNSAGTRLFGIINATSNGGFQVAATVQNSAGVNLELGSEIRLGSPGGVGLLHVRGALTTTAGASSLAPKIVGGAATNDYGRVRFRNTARVNLNGIVFENIGAPSENYAVRLEDGASVLAFNHVTITDSNAAIAAIELATDDVPTVFEGFSCSGAPNTGNIDASGINDIRIEVRESDTGSGNLYGVPHEIDPNGVLIWENPPVVDILSAANLPNGLAEVPYSETLSAAGGNEPLTWAIANNPEWLSINATTGELFGTPGRNDIGTHVFVVLASDDSTPSQSASKVMTIVIDSLTDVGVVIVTPAELLKTKVGEGYGYSLSAAGGTGAGYTYELVDVNALPMGLTLLPTGVIQGEPMPGSAGVYNFAVKVTDSQGNTGVKNFSMTVNTEFSDPAIIQAALNDGAGGGSGGCALGSSSTNWLVLVLAVFAGLFVLRRRQA